MPIREYKCPRCENIVERIVKHGQTRVVTCDLCAHYHAGERMEMEPVEYSTGAFHLHGGPGGWKNPSSAAKRVVNPDNVQWAK